MNTDMTDYDKDGDQFRLWNHFVRNKEHHKICFNKMHFDKTCHRAMGIQLLHYHLNLLSTVIAKYDMKVNMAICELKMTDNGKKKCSQDTRKKRLEIKYQ